MLVEQSRIILTALTHSTGQDFCTMIIIKQRQRPPTNIVQASAWSLEAATVVLQPALSSFHRFSCVAAAASVRHSNKELTPLKLLLHPLVCIIKTADAIFTRKTVASIFTDCRRQMTKILVGTSHYKCLNQKAPFLI